MLQPANAQRDTYERHRPEETPLYGIVESYYPTFLARLEAEGGSLPAFVKQAFDDYLNRGFTSHIVGVSRAESGALLEMLHRHIDSTPRLWCRIEWAPNTLAFWDNRCTQHHAIWDYYPRSRYGERVSILGDERPTA